jgi:hypothetical protein
MVEIKRHVLAYQVPIPGRLLEVDLMSGHHLDYSSRVLTKNGKLAVATMSLERLTGDEFGYGDSFEVYRRDR